MLVRILKSIIALSSPFLLHAQVSSVKLVVHVPAPPEGKQVYVSGSFNGWKAADSLYKMKREDASTYSLVLPVFRDVKYQYKYTLGSWDLVEHSANDSNINNRSFLSGSKKTSVKDTVVKWATGKPAPPPAISAQMERINKMKDSVLAGLQPKLNEMVLLLRDYITNLLQENPNIATDNRITEEVNKRFADAYGRLNDLFHRVFETMSVQQKQQILKAISAPGTEKDFINTLGKAINEATK
jgi:hypothetical protein